MKATLAEVGREMKSGGKAVLKTADLDGIARDLTNLAEQADHSLLETTGALALGTMRTAGNVLKGGVVTAGATARFVGRVVWQDVLGDYGRTLKRIYRRGFYGSVRTFLRPQARSYRNLFGYRFLSFTEIGLSLGRWRRAPWRWRPGLSAQARALS